MKRLCVVFAVLATAALSGCSTKFTLPKAVSVENYCDGAASFARDITAGRDQPAKVSEEEARKGVESEVANAEGLDKKEITAMLKVVGEVYKKENLGLDSSGMAKKIYNDCLEKRKNGTWFS